ncbi:acyltransferase [Nonomuraea turkmeniaca]|uniref:Acyltransferase n=1 Tax=Nonomuraea turkmeniaca TaxID=103838 RepID=A0A5S4FWH4_9ACTN|nr:acyltransferase [Nonomuraea turkmeniaca]TMR25155.1 acyltransferase [Nonomuraea turkmeniaca]
MGVVQEMRRLADRTPPGRDRQVDLLRAIAITAVVIGHWLAVFVLVTPDGSVRAGNVLEVVPWTRPLTWLFQVMPVFFLVGGYANAASLTACRDRGGDAAGWVLRRTDRLIRPTTMLLAVLTGTALVARAVGADPGLVGTAVWAAGIPLWFLVAYLAVVVLTPLTHALHCRYGLAVPAVLVVLVGAGDAARLALGVPLAAVANFLFAWLAVHQLGFAWQDGRLRARPGVGLPMAGIGLITLVVLTVAGPYPISMVGLTGEQIQNTSPPTLALLALAAAQTGLALAFHGPATRWLRRPRPWTVVVAVNSVIMTLFLWHMTAAVLGALALYRTGWLADPPGSAGWLLMRLPWLVVLTVILGVLVVAFGPVERHAGTHRAPGTAAGAPAGVLTVLGMCGVVAGILGIAVPGPGQRDLPGMALLAYFAGAAVVRLARRRT